MSQVDDWLDILETPYKFFENSFWLKGMYEQAGGQGAGVLLTGARGNFTISWGPAVYYYALLLRKMKWLQFMRELRLYSANKGIPGSRLLSVICKEAFPVLAKHAAPDAGSEIPGMLDPSRFRQADRRVRQAAGKRDRRERRPVTDPLELRKDKLKSLAVGNKNGSSATKLSLRYGAMGARPDLRSQGRTVLLLGAGGAVRAQRPRPGADPEGDEALFARRSRLNQRVRGVQGADWVHRIIPGVEIAGERAAPALRRSRRVELSPCRPDQGSRLAARRGTASGACVPSGDEDADAQPDHLPVPEADGLSDRETHEGR